MTAFAYTAYTDEGKRRTGTVIADTEAQAAADLKAQGLFVSELDPQTRKAGFTGTETGVKFPMDPKVLGPILKKHKLQLVSGWFSGRRLRTVRPACHISLSRSSFSSTCSFSR